MMRVAAVAFRAQVAPMVTYAEFHRRFLSLPPEERSLDIRWMVGRVDQSAYLDQDLLNAACRVGGGKYKFDYNAYRIVDDMREGLMQVWPVPGVEGHLVKRSPTAWSITAGLCSRGKEEGHPPHPQ